MLTGGTARAQALSLVRKTSGLQLHPRHPLVARGLVRRRLPIDIGHEVIRDRRRQCQRTSGQSKNSSNRRAGGTAPALGLVIDRGPRATPHIAAVRSHGSQGIGEQIRAVGAALRPTARPTRNYSRARSSGQSPTDAPQHACRSDTRGFHLICQTSSLHDGREMSWSPRVAVGCGKRLRHTRDLTPPCGLYARVCWSRPIQHVYCRVAPRAAREEVITWRSPFCVQACVAAS